MSSQKPKCKQLVLDAGPLLSLSPLRGLAESFITVPQVLAELKDKNAKEHLERLGLQFGIKIELKDPDPASLTAVIQYAKKTGDYAVLSHPDLCVLALTHTLQMQAQKRKGSGKEDEEANQTSESSVSPDTNPDSKPETTDESTVSSHSEGSEPALSYSEEEGPENTTSESEADEDKEALDVELHPIQDEASSSLDPQPAGSSSNGPIYDDPSDEDDGEGEWITPSNVAVHKSRALNLLPSENDGRKGKSQDEDVDVGCMTADFAMQNVLLQMGLNLVGTEGKRIQRVKTWVLRCHACYKICKDSSKKFCPSCGNPSLIRASVTISSPTASGKEPVMQVHLKPNFQYKIRGTKYSIPAPKPGSAKTGSGEGLILREDQIEYVRAKKRADNKKEREEAKMMKGVLSQKSGGDGVAIGSWMDPDWIPEIIAAGPGGKGRSVRSGGMDGEMPVVGYGRKNPNERRRKK
ncbi:20S-pre-rRNA D-site endonuclease nob1 [Stygiomarasmius scandens]|uniref:20S-pre-rRNA D-site endonuclease NOB1 n=1 Tax=Marasmiellus scandens TaxID=2682957 RepID=A0ABR1K465_9AGAR